MKKTFLFLIIFLKVFNCSAQIDSLSIKRIDKSNFILFLFDSKHVLIDSVTISQPLQDIITCSADYTNYEVNIVYSTNGTNQFTRGITINFKRYILTQHILSLTEESVLYWASNSKTRRFKYSFAKDKIYFVGSYIPNCSYTYEMKKFISLYTLKSTISNDLENSKCAKEDDSGYFNR